MTISRPVVSIGIPVFNGAETLGHTLDSILAQSFGDFEVVISDNASTDDTERICRDYARGDPRIRYFRSPTNVGARANYNRVFELSRGEYFRWNAHDDWIAPTYVERCLDAFERDPGAVACHTSVCRVPSKVSRERVIRAQPLADSESQVSRYHDALWMPYHPIFGMFRSSILRRTDLIPNCPQPDRVTLVQVALLGRYTRVDEVLFYRRRSRPRNYWVWLDPANARAPKRTATRLVRELWLSVDRLAEDGVARRLAMKADAVISVGIGGARGKLKKYYRRTRGRLRELERRREALRR